MQSQLGRIAASRAFHWKSRPRHLRRGGLSLEKRSEFRMPRLAMHSLLFLCLLLSSRRIRRCLPCPFIGRHRHFPRKTDRELLRLVEKLPLQLSPRLCVSIRAVLRLPPFACCRLATSHGCEGRAMPTLLFFCRGSALLSASGGLPSVLPFLASSCGLPASATCPLNCSYFTIASSGW